MGLSANALRELRRELAACEQRIAILRKLLAEERRLDAASNNQGAQVPRRMRRTSQRRNAGLRKVVLEAVRQNPGTTEDAIANLLSIKGFHSTASRSLNAMVKDQLRRLVQEQRVQRQDDRSYVVGVGD